jgi:hypothetical protein
VWLFFCHFLRGLLEQHTTVVLGDLVELKFFRPEPVPNLPVSKQVEETENEDKKKTKPASR